MHPGDLVVVGQPEQTPLAWYYLPGGLRFANTAGGLVKIPSYMDWVDALERLRTPIPPTAARLAGRRPAPGQQLLFVRPLTEGAQNWQAPWTKLVRRRSAQWGRSSERREPGHAAPGRLGAAQLPRCLLRRRQRGAVPQGLLTSGPCGPLRRPLTFHDHRHPPTLARSLLEVPPLPEVHPPDGSRATRGG